MKKLLLLTIITILYSTGAFAQHDLFAENNIHFTNKDYNENDKVKEKDINTQEEKKKILETISEFEDETSPVSIPDNTDYNVNDTESFNNFEDFRKE